MLRLRIFIVAIGWCVGIGQLLAQPPQNSGGSGGLDSEADGKLLGLALTPDTVRINTASFASIGFMPGDNESELRSVTADGSVAVGISGKGTRHGVSSSEPIEWSLSNGLQ